MRKKKDTNYIPPTRFIVVSEMGQVWTGIKGDELEFSNNWNQAKPLNNENQFAHLKRMSYLNLEQMFL
jgi:hypothetical protein